MKNYFSHILAILLGVLIGGYLFSDSQPRSVLAIHKCNNCWHPNEVTGLLTSALIQKFPSLMPSVVLETEQTIAIKHPAPTAPFHFVIFPKHDIQHLGDLAETDKEQMSDLIGVTATLIRENNLKTYTVWTNGPETQLVGYLHFHLAGS